MKFDLKKWISSILESIVTKHADCTLVTSVATGGYIRAYRTGNVVMLKIQNVSLKAFSARTQIATIPEGYRPAEESYGLLNNQPVTEYVLASPNGALSVQVSAHAGNRWGTLIYIVGGVLRKPVIARLLAIFKNGGGIDAFSQNIIGEDPHLDKQARSIINRTDILRNRNKHNTDKKWLACSSSEDCKSCANVCSSVENFPSWKHSCRSNRHPICDRNLPLFVLCEERYDIYHRSVSSNTRSQLAILAISERRGAA